MNQSENGPTLLYIMGAGRCGSTILSIMLGSHPDIEVVGEIKSWARHKGLPRDLDAKEEDFKFWENVLKEYIKSAGGLPDFDKLGCIYREIETPTKLIKCLFGKIKSETLSEYYKHIRNLIYAIHKVSTKKIVLDSSKSVFRAYNLLLCPNLNVRVIHLIRDPRGVLWSFMKEGVEQESKLPLKALFDYIALNGASIIIRYLFRNKVINVKYEDLIQQPTDTINRILNFVGLGCDNVVDMIENDAEFNVKHLIDGNRIRREKTINFNPDEAWKNNLPRSYRVLAKIMALPIYNL